MSYSDTNNQDAMQTNAARFWRRPSGKDTDHNRNIVHIEQGRESEEELTERGPLPLSPEFQDSRGKEILVGQARRWSMWGRRTNGDVTSSTTTRHRS